MTLAEQLRAMPLLQRQAFLARYYSPEELQALPWCWELFARPEQLAPPGNWRTWLLLGGKGSGKTRAAAEWVRAEAEGGRRREIGIVGQTADTVRRVQVEGPSGLLAISPPWAVAAYERSRNLVRYPNGAVVHLFSAEEPERLRGPNLDGLWLDEACSYHPAQLEYVWNLAQLALRMPAQDGTAARGVVSTTPRGIQWLKRLVESPNTAMSRMRTLDNRANLDASTVEYYLETYGGTTLGRQELDAEILWDTEGALWSRALLDKTRVEAAPADLARIVVGLDPSGTRRGDIAGIVVGGLSADGHYYVLQDASLKASPEGWASKAVAIYHSWQADRIAAEANFGADMVSATITAVDPSVPVKLVHASRGKAVRAEPIAATFERGRAHIVGRMPALEDELTGWEPGGNMPSPGRLDAMVWAVTELGAVKRPESEAARKAREWAERVRADPSVLEELAARLYAR
jgi:phage terminase large subunit-like protein